MATDAFCTINTRAMPWALFMFLALKPGSFRASESISLSFGEKGPLWCSLAWFLQVDSRDWALNGNTLSLDEETVIDVPEPYNHVSKYCASLGHKANHSFTPNCIYDMWVWRPATGRSVPQALSQEGMSQVCPAPEGAAPSKYPRVPCPGPHGSDSKLRIYITTLWPGQAKKWKVLWRGGRLRKYCI